MFDLRLIFAFKCYSIGYFCSVNALYSHFSVAECEFTVFFSLNILSIVHIVLNEEQSQFLKELVGPCSKFFEVSLFHLPFYFRIMNSFL